MGGGYITQSFPTNFHTFSSAIHLPPGADPAQWREVTPEERRTIEAADAAWTLPPALLIAQFNDAAGSYGRYNPDSGFFELNGINDITTDEAIRILRISAGFHAGAGQGWKGRLSKNQGVRTVMPLHFAGGDIQLALGGFAQFNGEIEVIQFVSVAVNEFTTDLGYAFFNCFNIREIRGPIRLTSTAWTGGAFANCRQLREVRLYQLGKDVAFIHSSQLSLESLDYLIRNKRPVAITVSLHPDTFAKLTGDYSNPAAEALTEEERRQWLELAALAAESQTTFTA